ncbi:MAG: tellurite resistance TerB family protein [Pseudomonadota bacterium]
MASTAQAALIHTMVLVSASDGNMSDSELATIGDIVRMLPVFSGFDDSQLSDVARECVSTLQNDDGLDLALNAIRDALPDYLRETAYAVACDVVAADGEASQEELRLLELLRHRIGVDRLAAAGIERGARARHMTP